MGYFPVYLDLRGRRCVVIGEDDEAQMKAGALVEAGAVLTVICPEDRPRFTEMAERGDITLHTRNYQPGDLSGAFLAISATTHDRPLSETIRDEAEREKCLLNVVDITDLCTWIYPALVRRGDATVAISTNGRSPAMASFLRREIDSALPPEYGLLLDVLADVREELRGDGRMPPSGRWQTALNDDETRRLISAGDDGALRERLIAILTGDGGG